MKNNSKFIIGITFLTIGITTKNYAFMGIGAAWAALGITKKSNNKKDKK